MYFIIYYLLKLIFLVYNKLSKINIIHLELYLIGGCLFEKVYKHFFSFRRLSLPGLSEEGFIYLSLIYFFPSYIS